MKLLKLKIRNINSIYGTWTIDFERPEYAENGIFLLTGPTGSGKSTILDAICLALFGRTPRVPIISGNRNDVLSRRQKDCGAELLFETGGGTLHCFLVAESESKQQPESSPTRNLRRKRKHFGKPDQRDKSVC